MHLGKEPFAATSLKFASVFEVGKAPLADAGLGQLMRVYFRIFGDLFWVSLGL